MLDELQSWLDQLQTWWLGTTPATQATFQAGGVVLAALLGGYLLGVLVARNLRSWNFDAALRLPGSSPPDLEADRGFTRRGWPACSSG